MAEQQDGNADENRFASLTEDQLNSIIEESDAKNTKRSTKTAITIFRNYLSSKGLNIDFENFTSTDLDKILTKFYAEIRQENGDFYKKSTLITIRHGINRYLQKANTNVDIINGVDFVKSKQMFSAVCKDLKRKGNGGGKHYPIIEESDLKKMMNYLNNDANDNIKLLEKVFVDIMLYFGRRGRENLRDLKITDFEVAKDGDGSTYLYMVRDEKTKNHQDDKNTAEGRMYAMPGK